MLGFGSGFLHLGHRMGCRTRMSQRWPHLGRGHFIVGRVVRVGMAATILEVDHDCQWGVDSSSMDYEALLARKRRDWIGSGLADFLSPGSMKPFQERLAAWALRKGRAALFADTGLGKTRMQLAWADNVPGRVLILAPLCVGPQTMGEAQRIGLEVGAFDSGARITTTNYERLHHVHPADYAGVVLDESSILKSMDGKTRTRLIAMFRDTPYRLCCTATPAPNDIAELANHCEFLGIMPGASQSATMLLRTLRQHPEARKKRAALAKDAQPKLL